MLADVDGLHVKRNKIVGMNYLGIIDLVHFFVCVPVPHTNRLEKCTVLVVLLYCACRSIQS